MKISIRKIAFSAVIAAVYAALTMSTSFMSYGAVQFRLAEALNILPFFFPETLWGLFVGCCISNLISGYGIYDLIFGSLATLLAAGCIAALGRSRMQNRLWTKIAACFVPVLVNAVIVGAVIAASTVQGGAFWSALLVNGAQVGLGELAVMYLIGLPLMLWLPKSHVFTEISQRLNQRNGGDS